MPTKPFKLQLVKLLTIFIFCSFFLYLSCKKSDVKEIAAQNDVAYTQASTPSGCVDNVSGFTYSEIQSAYYAEPVTMIDFKNALKAIKPSQATAIDQLFNSYGY